jgi:heme exporter protein D
MIFVALILLFGAVVLLFFFPWLAIPAALIGLLMLVLHFTGFRRRTAEGRS